jgi:hypothetical protein
MITKQEVINSALLSFGNEQLVSSTISYVDLKYKILYQKLIALQYWNFLQTITDLGLVSDTSELFGYKYKYNIPSDSANIFSVFYKNIVDQDYKIIGDFIYSNNLNLKCQYTSSVEREQMPVHFATCLSYLLASELCVALGSSNYQVTLLELYQEALTEAKAVNGKDVPSVKYTSNYYTTARY